MRAASNITDFTGDGAIDAPLAPSILPATAARSETAPASPVRSALAQRTADLFDLTKPRMNLLILVTTTVGYIMAGGQPGRRGHLVSALLGTALCAAAASVLNQVWEREFDALMPRTRNRPLPAGRMASHDALILGVVLGIVGITTLALLVNSLTATLGAFTLLSYVLIYTPMKRRTTLCTLAGAVPGAIPPVMGWAAVHGTLGPQALALFAILFIWQMPHFLAIAILYRDDYARGGFCMLPVEDEDLAATSRQIVLFSTALIPVTLVPAMLGMSGPAYFTAAVLLGLAFLSFAISAAASKSRLDARKLFFASIVYLPALLGFMVMDRLT